MSDIGLDNPLKPDIPGPDPEQVRLQQEAEKRQQAALEKELLDSERENSEDRKRRRKLLAGNIGLRSLLSGISAGSGLGG